MKRSLIFFLSVCSFTIVASAQDTDRVSVLEQKVQMLEKRLAAMEKRTANSEATPAAKKMMKVAREHSAAERQAFNAADIARAEVLYEQAAKMLDEEESKALLDSLVADYPQLNRAGCAQLYRAQQETGAEKERLLSDCIARFSNCYYFDGAQVGPLAMLQLADYYEAAGKEHNAHKLLKRIRRKSPDAVGHNGELLVDMIDRANS